MCKVSCSLSEIIREVVKSGRYNESWIFGYMIDGCQAEYVRVPHANLGMHSIPDGLIEEDVLFVGTSCPLAASARNKHALSRVIPWP